MPVFLSQTTIATVKATIPALETHGVTITQQMYDRIFEDPAIRACSTTRFMTLPGPSLLRWRMRSSPTQRTSIIWGRLQSLCSGSRKSTFARVSCQRITKWWRKH